MRILVLLLSIFAAAVAHAYETKIVGGPGGQRFQLDCPDNRSLAGMFLRFDESVTQVDAVCVSTIDGAWRDQPRRALSNGYNQNLECDPICPYQMKGMVIGGYEGHTNAMIVCPPDSLVYAMNVATYPVPTRAGEIEVVGRVKLHCVNPKTGREDVLTPIPEPEGTQEYTEKWPADCRSQSGKFWATGLHGRTGSRIDALGLRCVSPNAPARPMRDEALRSPPPVMSPVDSNRNLSPSRIGRAPTRFGDAASAPPPAPPPPAAPPSPKSQIFYHPQAASYERLHACLYLPKTGCGRPAALEFCKSKGFAQAAYFEVEKGRLRSETVYGELCRQGKCRVFTEIECAN